MNGEGVGLLWREWPNWETKGVDGGLVVDWWWRQWSQGWWGGTCVVEVAQLGVTEVWVLNAPQAKVGLAELS